MRRLFLSVSVALLSLVLMTPMAGAQHRPGSRSGSGSRTENASHQRGSGNVRPGGGNQGNVRPGNDHNMRPGNGAGTRPGGGNQGNVRPGNDHNMRPGNGAGTRPGMGTAPQPSHRPTPPHNNRPGVGAARPIPPRPGVGTPPPPRPPQHFYPYNRPFVRPVPPPGFRARYRAPLLSQFLGVTFGMTVANSVNILTRGGYSVTGYGNEEVFLRNVNEMGTMWNEATLHYTSGALVRSTFYNSTSYDYTATYDRVFDRLTNTYGSPVSASRTSAGLSAAWFGYNGDYITLEYSLLDTPSGYRYFTVLTYGN